MTEIKIPALVEMDIPPILAMAKLERLKREDVPILLAKMLARPGDEAHLLMNQFQLFSIAGNQTFALEMLQLALAQQVIYRVESTQPPALRLLALMGAGDTSDNTPLDYLIENSDIQLDLLFIVPGQPLPDNIPDHDVAIVALGESSKNQATLALMETLISHWPRPVLNHPHQISLCARDRLYQQLKSIPNLLISPTLRHDKTELSRIAKQGLNIAEIDYPLTLRPIDTQAGIGLCKIANPAELNAYLLSSDAQEFFVSSYIDYRHADGQYRKIRIALIDGAPYVAHLAIGDNWIVHYKNAGMLEDCVKREKEAQFMHDFDTDFALRHQRVLRDIAARLALDYVVLDCAETADGKFLLFEADNRGWVHATDPLEFFSYKQVPMRKLFAAFRTLLFKTKK